MGYVNVHMYYVFVNIHACINFFCFATINSSFLTLSQLSLSYLLTACDGGGGHLHIDAHA